MYKRDSVRWLKHIDFMIFDLLCLEFSFIIVYFIRMRQNPFLDEEYLNILFLLVFIDIFVFFLFEPYKNILKRGLYREFMQALKQTIIIVSVLMLYIFALQMGIQFSRIVIFVASFTYFLLSFAVRCIRKNYLQKKSSGKEGKSSLLIVTNKRHVENAVQNIKSNNYERFKIKCVILIDAYLNGMIYDDIPVIASDDILSYIQTEWVDEVLIDLPINEQLLNNDMIETILDMGITVHLNLFHENEAMMTTQNSQHIERIGNATVLTSSLKTATTQDLFMKRSVDIFFGLCGSIIACILGILIAPFIYAKSPGPLIFTQIRVGKNGKQFKIYKFRSMYMDAEKRKKELLEQNMLKDSKMFKLKNDPRIIGCEKGSGKGIGNFIRKTSIDEFPQFFNVLKGDMSVVGTRPPSLDEWNEYDAHHRARLAIKPGITGLWQVSGRSNITDFEEVVRIDKKYINDWSIGLDFKIILKTIIVVLKKEGSV